jgi:hypothetical protein
MAVHLELDTSWCTAGSNHPLTPSFGFAHQFRCSLRFVIPAKAGIQTQRDEHRVWMPAFAGMTVAG